LSREQVHQTPPKSIPEISKKEVKVSIRPGHLGKIVPQVNGKESAFSREPSKLLWGILRGPRLQQGPDCYSAVGP
jgi:hypothetical protein